MVDKLGMTRLTRGDHHRKIDELVEEVGRLRSCLEYMRYQREVIEKDREELDRLRELWYE